MDSANFEQEHPDGNLTPEQLNLIDSKHNAAKLKRKKLFDETEQKRLSTTLGSSTTIIQRPSIQPPAKRTRKTDEQLLREEELRDAISHGQVVRVQGNKLIDTGGGFLLEEKDLIEEEQTPVVIVEEPAPIIEGAPICDHCGSTFSASFLFQTYDHKGCDSCKDSDGIHSYITRTDAKNEYLLKDEDFDRREPPLKYISRPNPHNARWGDMKLYLRLQVEKRAVQIWGSLDKISAERELREENRVKSKIKKYNKKMKTLRMAARSSLYTRDLAPHTHEWGDEVYDESRDEYTHVCKDCGQRETYEKM